MNDALARLLSFFRFTHGLHTTERVARTPGTERYANTAEHTFQIALVAWYLIDTYQLPLDRDKVLRYALAHDSPEAYAGDTYVYDKAARVHKHEREQEARNRMRNEFPEFKGLHEALVTYEERVDPESRFVYALDKLMDPVNIYLEDGKLWHEKQVTLPMLLEYKFEKTRLDPTIAALFDALVVEFKAREHELFPKSEA
jgi:putative hydrolase of HD superfamily